MVGLLFASVGSIIGSGWLFGALGASLIAGPAALISWVLGCAAVILLALIHAELGGMGWKWAGRFAADVEVTDPTRNRWTARRPRVPTTDL